MKTQTTFIDPKGETDVPVWLAQVADVFTRQIGVGDYRTWVAQFIEAIPENTTEKTLEEEVMLPFVTFMLESSLEDFDHKKFPEVKKVVGRAIRSWENGDFGDAGELKEEAWAVATAHGAIPGAASAAHSVVSSRQPAASVLWSVTRPPAEEKHILFADELIRLLRKTNPMTQDEDHRIRCDGCMVLNSRPCECAKDAEDKPNE